MSMAMELLGEPFADGEGDGVAYQIALTREKLEAIRRAWNLPSPSYIYLRPEDLGDLSPLERAAQMALEDPRSAEHTSELQSLMRTSYAVFCLKKKKKHNNTRHTNILK